MKKILCPTDFSETASHTIAYAAKLAKKTGASLTLFNVQSLVDLTPEQALMGEAFNQDVAESALEEQCQEVTKVFKISCYGDVATSIGSLHRTISEKARGHDLIVMGTQGPDDLLQFFRGSHTYQVIKKSSVPVLLVPEGYDFANISRTAYAFNYLQSHDAPMVQVVNLVKQLESELTVVQILESYTRETELTLLEAQKSIRNIYGDEVKISFDTLRAAEVAASLNIYVIQNKIDLLALCSVHHGLIDKLFHRSVIKALSRIASYPLFVFHD